MNRRGFLTAILASSVAPAIVRAGSLMKVVAPLPPEFAEMIWTEGPGGLFTANVFMQTVRAVDFESGTLTMTYGQIAKWTRAGNVVTISGRCNAISAPAIAEAIVRMPVRAPRRVPFQS
jgi:hypothetical protein